jgi:hypothetical protein
VNQDASISPNSTNDLHGSEVVNAPVLQLPSFQLCSTPTNLSKQSPGSAVTIPWEVPL